MIKKKDNQNEKKIPETPAAVKGHEEVGEERAGEETAKIGEQAEKQEPDPVEKLRTQLEEKTREAAENLDKWLRARAEFENFKKRAQRERADTIKFGNENLLRDILPALDNLSRAIEEGKKTKEIDSLLAGVEIIYRQFLSLLEKYGVKPIQAVGDLFNPEKHEALAHEENHEENEEEPHRVVAEVEKGYLFHDRLLRPAKVIVSKGKTAKKIEGT